MQLMKGLVISMILATMLGCSTVKTTGKLITQVGLLKYHYTTENVLEVVLSLDLTDSERLIVNEAAASVLGVYDKVGDMSEFNTNVLTDYYKLKQQYVQVYGIVEHHWSEFDESQQKILNDVHNDVLILDQQVEDLGDILTKQQRVESTLKMINNIAKIISVI